MASSFDIDVMQSLVATAFFKGDNPPTGTVTINGTPQVGQVLTAANTLADRDGLGTISYQWTVGSTVIPKKSTTYTPVAADIGKTITVTASYFDGFSVPERVGSSATAAVKVSLVQILDGLYLAMGNKSPNKTEHDGYATALVQGTMTVTALVNKFAALPAWQTAYPTTLTDAQYVDGLYQKAFGITSPDVAGRAFWLGKLTTKQLTRPALAAAIVEAGIQYDPSADKTSTATEKATATQAQTAFTTTLFTKDLTASTVGGQNFNNNVPVTTPTFMGGEYSLTTDTDSITSLSFFNQIITGLMGNLNTGDIIIDNTTTDADVLTTAGVEEGTQPIIQNIETLNISNSVTTGLDLTRVTGATTLNLSTTIAGFGTATVTNAKVSAASALVAGSNIKTLNVATDAQGTGGDLKINAGNATTVNLTGGTGTDSILLTTTGDVTLKGSAIDNVLLTANPAPAVGTSKSATPVITLDHTTPLLSYIPAAIAAAYIPAIAAAALGVVAVEANGVQIVSANDVELKADITDLASRTVLPGNGKLTVSLSAASSVSGTQDLSKIIAGNINLINDLGANATLKIAEGATLSTPVDQSNLVLSEVGGGYCEQ